MEQKMILEGYRVVDWSVHQNGPYAAAMLADLGADVIHVEWRGTGDLLRGLNPSFGLSQIHPSGRHINFEEHNRNKRGLAVDLKKPEGKEIMYHLVEKSDVFLTNFRFKAAAKLGMDYETLSKLNPRLVYAVATGFGERGPEADSLSFDLVAQARGGTLFTQSEKPTMGVSNIADRSGAIITAYATLAALFARERFGIGQQVICSQLASTILLQGYCLMLTMFQKRDLPNWSRKGTVNPLYNFYQTKDKEWVVLGGLEERYWPPFCQVVGRPELADNPKFSTLEKRAENHEELFTLIEEIMASKTKDEWATLFKQREIFFSPVNRPSQLESDPQIIANDYITTWDHPILGPFKIIGFPFHFSKTQPSFRMPAPEVGQHTEEILMEIGYTWDDIAKLKDKEVI